MRYSWSQAQSAVPAGTGRRDLGRDLPAGPLPEAVPRALCRSGDAGPADQGDQVARLGPAVPAQGPASTSSTIPTCRPCSPGCRRSSPPAQRFVAVRNPYYLPRRRQGAAAALSRPLHPGGGRPQADPDQDRRPARPTCRPGTCSSRTTPSSSRASSAAGCGCCCGPRAGAPTWRCSPTSTPSDPVWRELFRDLRFRRGPLARDRSGGAEPVHLFRPGARLEQLDHPAEPACTSDEYGTRCTAHDPEAAEPSARRARPRQAQPQRGAAAARRPAAGADRRDHRRGQRADGHAGADPRPVAGARLHDPSPSRRTARCCATGSSRAMR